ncbi:MAG: hypothetical protein KAH44_15295 [Oricola sp.]|nr:hypothetical protein [Oricola sp.]
MPFDWKRAMKRGGLIGIVTRLFVLAGIRTGRSVILLMLAIGGEAKT